MLAGLPIFIVAPLLLQPKSNAVSGRVQAMPVSYTHLVVLTVGEKIGKQGMTYAQGMSAQITAAAAIGMARCV